MISGKVSGMQNYKKRSNRLAGSQSPYLLQHAENPVDWYPWGDEAFQKAAVEDKPVFLSIGYATCHWCHVMAHESFEDQQVADLLNRHFVSIKVDREERPDIDQVYMSVCQALTGRGGWPLSVFMTPERKPFFAGTYFPRETRRGMAGFLDICSSIADLWKNDRHRLLDSSEKITEAVQPSDSGGSGMNLDNEILDTCFQHLQRAFDPEWGGFSNAPKFPTPHNCFFLLRRYQRTGEKSGLRMVEKTLESMRKGGIFDQVGYGFHRYSVDERWLVPHFEKMLYDQALLSLAYTEAFQVTGRDFYRDTVRFISEYVLRDMTSPLGGFYSAEDADSEGEEGLFYLWKKREILERLGKDDGELFCRFFNISGGGNFENGFSIPHTTESIDSFSAQEGVSPGELRFRLEQGRASLFQLRENRIHPLKDDKILAAWNGLMIAALARAFQALGEERLLAAARRCADFVLDGMRRKDGGIYRSCRQGQVVIPGFQEDYAFLVWGLIELYEASFEARYLAEALDLNRVMIDLFQDASGGGFFFSGSDNERLIARARDIYDGATPSGNSVAIMNLLRLSRMTGNPALEARAEKALTAFSAQVNSYPPGFTYLLSAVDFLMGPTREIVVSGDSRHSTTREMIHAVHRSFLPNKVILFRGRDEEMNGLEGMVPYLQDMGFEPGHPRVYWCENYTCKEPINSVDKLRETLESAAKG